MRVVIVDDEPLARARLRTLLTPHVDVEVVGEAASADEASSLVKRSSADVLMLDIDMPRRSGFDLLEQLGNEVPRVVIFTTAHPEFAARAFDVSAADYLLKPFDQERLDRAIERARRLSIRGIVAQPARHARWRERFAVRFRGQIIFVKAFDVLWIGAEGNYARLHTRDSSFLIREALRNLEESLDPRAFVRVHRSAIVNIDRIEKAIATTDGNYSIVLTGGAAVPLGPSYRSRLEAVMGEKL